jgi:hypothetical protein
MFKCRNCGQELTDEIRFDLGWHCDYPCDTVTRDEDIQPERLSEKTRKGSDSLNSMETWRGRSEEVSPPAV